MLEQLEQPQECQCNNKNGESNQLSLDTYIAGLVSREIAKQLTGAIDELNYKFNEAMQTLSLTVTETQIQANFKSINIIQEKFNTQKWRDKIRELPIEISGFRSKIHTRRTELRSMKQSLADAELALKEAEASLLIDVTDAVDAAGKKLFSNDKTRQAELLKRKKTDTDYLAATQHHNYIKSNVESMEDSIYELENELKTLEAEFAGACKILESMTAEMQIYAQMCGYNVLPALESTDISACNGSDIATTQYKENNKEEERMVW